MTPMLICNTCVHAHKSLVVRGNLRGNKIYTRTQKHAHTRLNALAPHGSRRQAKSPDFSQAILGHIYSKKIQIKERQSTKFYFLNSLFR